MANDGAPVIKVDIPALQQFESELRRHATDLVGFGTVPPAILDAATALPGTTFGDAFAGLGDVITGALTQISQRVDVLADIAKGTQNNYELSEQEFTGKLKAIG